MRTSTIPTGKEWKLLDIKKTIFFLYYYYYCGREGGFGITGALVGYFLGSYADWYGRKNLENNLARMLSDLQLPAEVRFSYSFCQLILYFIFWEDTKGAGYFFFFKYLLPQVKTELSVTLDSRSQSWSRVGGSKLQSLKELECPQEKSCSLCLISAIREQSWLEGFV